MMNFRRSNLAVCWVICLATVVGTLGQSQAQQDADNKTEVDEKLVESSGLSQAALAARLALEGSKNRSPLMLLVAADILDGLKSSDRSLEGIQSSAASEEGNAGGDKSPPTLDPTELRQRALALASSDEERQMLQQWLERPAPRGLIVDQGKDLKSVKIKAITFKVLIAEVLKPGDKRTFNNVIFEGKRPAIVLVVGDGDGDLDLWVYDAKTNGLIGKDVDLTSICEVRWTPRYEGPFRIEVANVGDVAEECIILVNW